jgi:hypothetical protein
MGIVTAHISMSLDGFVAGPNAGAGNPLGDGGARIQQWMFDLASFREIQGLTGGQTNRDDEVLRERFAPTGAVVMGRRMFDEGEGPWGHDLPFHMPVLVVTHEPVQVSKGRWNDLYLRHRQHRKRPGASKGGCGRQECQCRGRCGYSATVHHGRIGSEIQIRLRSGSASCLVRTAPGR